MKTMRNLTGILGLALIPATVTEASPPRARCQFQLVICAVDAASLESSFARAAAELDCAVDFANCWASW